MARKPIVVIGSINMDLVCRTPAMPRPGETVMGSDLQTIPGGKGANQAVAAARLGEEVHLVGRVGKDDFGERLLNGLQQHKVNTDRVIVTEGAATGCAMILVDKKGENSIVVVPGANARLTPDDMDAAAGIIATASIVIMQLEIPLKTAEHACEICRRAGVRIILDPTPVPPRGLSKSLYQVDILTPNQNEAESLLERRELGRMKRTKRSDVKQLAERLLERGPETVVLKLGPKGAVVMDNEVEQIKGYKVRVVDTTAAGDAFTAALAVGIAEGMELGRAVRFANAAGARCCETFGAQPALPTRMEVEAVMGGIH